MGTKNKVLPVRFDEKEYKMIEQVGDKAKISKAEVVRYGMRGELYRSVDRVQRRREVLKVNEETRLELLKLTADILTAVQKLETEQKRIGVNINQLAKDKNQERKKNDDLRLSGMSDMDRILRNVQERAKEEMEAAKGKKSNQEISVEGFNEVSKKLEQLGTEVHELWQLLA